MSCKLCAQKGQGTHFWFGFKVRARFHSQDLDGEFHSSRNIVLRVKDAVTRHRAKRASSSMMQDSVFMVQCS